MRKRIGDVRTGERLSTLAYAHRESDGIKVNELRQASSRAIETYFARRI